jgi:DinB family protein
MPDDDRHRSARAAALEYLRRKGTDAPSAKILAGLRSTFQKFEQAIERVPEDLRTERPAADAWSVHEIVDHLVESDRPAVAELRALCAGASPTGGPIPARLMSARPFDRAWPALLAELKAVHATLIEIVGGAGDDTPLSARAPSVMVIKVPTDHGSEVLEWIEPLDWKAYAQALRVHMHEHLAQVERTVAALDEQSSATGGPR